MNSRETAAAHVSHRDGHLDSRVWRQSRGPRWLSFATLTAVAAIAIASVGVGSVSIAPLITLKILLARLPGAPWVMPTEALWPNTYERILLDIRLPRVVLVALTGTALACSGTAYQALFRNPLADPYLIGVAAGASLGGTCAIVLQQAYLTGIGPLLIPLGAFIGALVTVAVVYMLGRVGRRAPVTTLLLAGVAVGAFAVNLTTFVMLRAGQQTAHILAYLLGGYSSAGWEAVRVVLPFTVAGFVLLYVYARPLNLLLFDEEQAQQLGLNVERTKLAVVAAATMTTAAAVAFSGLIGFVGLIVPHAARLLVGPDHRRLLPLAALGGAGFLMLADLIARTVIAPEELPLGVVTSVVGVPFFLYLLRRVKHAAFF